MLHDEHYNDTYQSVNLLALPLLDIWKWKAINDEITSTIINGNHQPVDKYNNWTI